MYIHVYVCMCVCTYIRAGVDSPLWAESNWDQSVGVVTYRQEDSETVLFMAIRCGYVEMGGEGYGISYMAKVCTSIRISYMAKVCTFIRARALSPSLFTCVCLFIFLCFAAGSRLVSFPFSRCTPRV